jgi:hypothetical protein
MWDPCKIILGSGLFVSCLIFIRQTYWLILLYFGRQDEESQNTYLKNTNYNKTLFLLPLGIAIFLMWIIGCD